MGARALSIPLPCSQGPPALVSPFHAPCTGRHESVSDPRAFLLGGAYADTIRTTVCILLGVQPELLFLIMFIDGTYGAFIHIGDNLVKDARFGVLNKIMLTLPIIGCIMRAIRSTSTQISEPAQRLGQDIWHLSGRRPVPEDRLRNQSQDEFGSFLNVYFGEFVAWAETYGRRPAAK